MASHPYKMPKSTWLVPGGNRDIKKQLFLHKSFPMSSAIKKNLGGPLSSVFFESLSVTSQDQVGFTPTLSGIGREYWVSPSDILINKVAIKPPFTNRLKLARTHHWIMEVGGKYLQKISDIYAHELGDALIEQEKVLKKNEEMAIRKAVQKNRTIINEMHREETELLINSLKEGFIKTLNDLMESIRNEFRDKLEKELKAKELLLNKQLHTAIKAKEEYLRHEFAFQLDWQANRCFEKYQLKLKKREKEWLKLFDEEKESFEHYLAKMKTQMESENFNALLGLHHKNMWDCHEEKQEMQLFFRNWYIEEFKKELASRDFAIIDLEKSLATKTQEVDKNISKIKDIFKQFQKFINFALKAKPGQAEFLLSLQFLLKEDWKELDVKQENIETETETIAKSIMEHLLKNIFTQRELEAILFEPKLPQKQENFVQEIEMERIANRALKVVGETVTPPGSKESFQQKRLDSLKIIFEKYPSLNQFIKDEQKDSARDK